MTVAAGAFGAPCSRRLAPSFTLALSCCCTWRASVSFIARGDTTLQLDRRPSRCGVGSWRSGRSPSSARPRSAARSSARSPSMPGPLGPRARRHRRAQRSRTHRLPLLPAHGPPPARLTGAARGASAAGRLTTRAQIRARASRARRCVHARHPRTRARRSHRGRHLLETVLRARPLPVPGCRLGPSGQRRGPDPSRRFPAPAPTHSTAGCVGPVEREEPRVWHLISPVEAVLSSSCIFELGVHRAGG